MVWFRQLLNTVKKPIFKIPFSRNSKSSVWKPNFFIRQAIPEILSALHSHYTGDTQYRVWFDLDNSLTRCKRIIFKILKKSQFAKFAKFRMKTNFFLSTLYQKFFALHSHYTGDTPYRVWFDLDNSLTRWKATIFKILKNSKFAKFAKFRMKNHFSPRQALPTTFFLYTLITLVILNTEFGLVWTTPWCAEKEFFLKFSKTRNSRNSQNSVCKPNFFLSTLFQVFLLYTLITLVILHTAFGLISTTA